MESGNSSSSVQSSSGTGDEEYDSRADSASSSLTPPPASSNLDPFSAYFDAFSSRIPPAAASNSSPFLNCTGIVGLAAGSAVAAPYASCSSSSTQIDPCRRPLVGSIHMGSPLPPSSLWRRPSAALPPLEQSPSGGVVAAAPPRGSKKRPRASRRAPTTVLTTDTSNFRAMVQEFTGVPSPPFPSQLFVRPRLDLLRAGIAGESIVVPDPTPAGHLLRPFAQKVPVPFASGSSSTPSCAYAVAGDGGSAGDLSPAATSLVAAATSSTGAGNASTAGAAAAATTGTAIAASSRHLPWNAGFGNQHHNLLGVFDFQSLLPLSPAAQHDRSPDAPPSHGVRSRPTAEAAAAARGIGDGGHGDTAGRYLGTLLPSGIAGSQGSLSLSRGGGGNTGRDDVVLRWLENSSGAMGGGDGGEFSPAGGSHGDRRLGNSCMLNCAGSASPDYHLPEKGKEEIVVPAAGGEGMVDSWIRGSSD